MRDQLFRKTFICSWYTGNSGRMGKLPEELMALLTAEKSTAEAARNTQRLAAVNGQLV